jgi:hypothetical protein
MKIRTLLKKKKGDIALVLLWTALIALIVIKIYWVGYTTIVGLYYYKELFPQYGGPTPGVLDLVIVLLAGIPVGLSLSDLNEMIYGYAAAMSLAFVISVTYVTLYIWYVLGWGEVFGMVAFDWEYAVFFAMEWVLRIMFPWVMGLCLVGLTVGAFLRTWMGRA